VSLRWRDSGGALRTAGAVSIRDASSALLAVDQIRVRDADNVLREVYKQGIRLAATPTFVYGTGISGPITTNSVTVGVAGGTPPYTHAWTVGGSVVANSPTSATTSFTKSGASVEATATDLVTDVNGLFNSINVPVSIERGSPDA
jgi:hypothetical protein